MQIVGPYRRNIAVTIPVGDSRRTVKEYKEAALSLAHLYADQEGYPVVDYETTWDAEGRTVRAVVTVEVHDYFEDEEGYPWR